MHVVISVFPASLTENRKHSIKIGGSRASFPSPEAIRESLEKTSADGGPY
jgi:hypothetical protein